MFSEKISNEYIVTQQGTSEGTQIKYKKGDYWYKKDHRGHEGMAEYLVSNFLKYTDLKPEEFVIYEYGTINGQTGCRSKNFLNNEEELVTIYRLYFNEYGKDLSQVINGMDEMEERIDYVIRFVQKSCGIDIFDYLRKIFTVDMITLNEDRHLNNIALVFDGNSFKPSPIFDNGLSLLTGNQSVNWNLPVSENVKRVIARPFSGSHEKMAGYFGKGIAVDTKKALEWLNTQEWSREREVLEYQIKRYNGKSIPVR